MQAACARGQLNPPNTLPLFSNPPPSIPIPPPPSSQPASPLRPPLVHTPHPPTRPPAHCCADEIYDKPHSEAESGPPSSAQPGGPRPSCDPLRKVTFTLLWRREKETAAGEPPRSHPHISIPGYSPRQPASTRGKQSRGEEGEWVDGWVDGKGEVVVKRS